MSPSEKMPARRGNGAGPARGYSWPPFAVGNTDSLRHGLFSQLLRPTDETEIEELARALHELVPLNAPAFSIAIGLLAGRLWRLRRAYRFVAETSEGDLPRNFSEKLNSLERLVDRSLRELGLTPAAAAELGVNLKRLADAGEHGPSFDWAALEPGERVTLERLLAKGRQADGGV